MVRNPLCLGFFALCSQPFLCEFCSTSQTLLAHSGPHPSNTISPDPCSDFPSSFNPSDHSPPPTAAPDPVLKPPPYAPSSFPSSAAPNPLPCLCQRRALRPHPHTLTPRVPGLYPDLPRSPPHTQPLTSLRQEASQQDPTPFPVPCLPLQKAAGAESIVWVSVPFSLTICLKLKSILAASPQTLILI